VTSASSFGRLFTDTELTYDRRTQDIVRAYGRVVERPGDAERARGPGSDRDHRDVQQTASLRCQRGHRPHHARTRDDRVRQRGRESPLGDLIADAQLADDSSWRLPEPVIAFMNPGGIRPSLTYAASKWSEAPGDITYEEAFTVQPFNNYLVSMDLKGSDIYALLTQQVTGLNAGSHKKTLQVSAGFTYTMTRPVRLTAAWSQRRGDRQERDLPHRRRTTSCPTG
jgi:5'-nucleotidase